MTDLSKIPWKGLAVLLACVAAGRSLVAQEPAPAPEAAVPAPATTPAPADVEAAPEREDKADDASAAETRAPKPAAATGSPQRFEPTERVRPDFDVAFPIDI